MQEYDKTYRKNKRDRTNDTMCKGHYPAVDVVDGDLSTALREFKSQMKNSGILLELYSRTHFIKKSEKRKKVIENAKYKNYMSLKS